MTCFEKKSYIASRIGLQFSRRETGNGKTWPGNFSPGKKWPGKREIYLGENNLKKRDLVHIF